MQHASKKQRWIPKGWEELSCPCCFRPGAPLCEDFAPADIAAKLAGLRSLLKAHSLGAYIVPSGDAHSSEYVSETDKRREWLTGFTGSAGVALVTADKALVWTDGRYFTQAAQQLAGTEWQLMRMNEPGVPELEEWAKAHQAALGGPIGADPRLVTLDFAAEWERKGCAELTLVADNLVDIVWAKQPPLSCAPLEPHPLGFSGERVADKLARVGAQVRAAGCGALMLGALDQLCWLFNLRGKDIECNPVFLGYAVLAVTQPPPPAAVSTAAAAPRAAPGAEAEAEACGECDDEGGAALRVVATLFLRALDTDAPPHAAATLAKVRAHLAAEGCEGGEGGGGGGSGARVELMPYRSFGAEEAARCAAAGEGGEAAVVMLERTSTTQAMAAGIPAQRRQLVDVSPVEQLKATKNALEVQGLVSAGCKDAAAIVSYLAWLGAQLTSASAATVTEAHGADEMGRRRAAMPGSVGDSFPTISSTGANAAIIHYQAAHGACSDIAADAVYLCDTGGQYLDGTTDITRTVHFGTPTEDERRAYTRVLQGHVDLAAAIFPAGTPGLMLEMLSRAPLWQDGLNFLHGTGHGMGAYLNVHEGPAGIGGGAAHISQCSEARRRMYLHPIEEGFYLSDEPGFYREGAFGIRIESDLVVQLAATRYAWGTRPYLSFRYCTPVPFCRALVDASLLTPSQREWVDAHHVRCRKEVTAELLRRAARGGGAVGEAEIEEDVKRSLAWLEAATQPL